MSSFYSHSRCALKLLLDNCSEFYKKCTCIFFSIHIDKMFLCFSTNGFWTSFQTWHRKNHTSLRLHRCRARIDAGYFFFSTTLANVYVSLYWYVALRRTSTETFNMCQSAMNAVHYIYRTIDIQSVLVDVYQVLNAETLFRPFYEYSSMLQTTEADFMYTFMYIVVSAHLYVCVRIKYWWRWTVRNSSFH